MPSFSTGRSFATRIPENPSQSYKGSIFGKPRKKPEGSIFGSKPKPPLNNNDEQEKDDFGLNASGVTASGEFPDPAFEFSLSPWPPSSPLPPARPPLKSPPIPENEDPKIHSPSNFDDGIDGENDHDETGDQPAKLSAADEFFAAQEAKRKAQLQMTPSNVKKGKEVERESEMSSARPGRRSIRDLGVIINSKMRPRTQKNTVGLSSAWQDHDDSGTYDPDEDTRRSSKRNPRRKKTTLSKEDAIGASKEEFSISSNSKGKQSDKNESGKSTSNAPDSGSQKATFADEEMTELEWENILREESQIEPEAAAVKIPKEKKKVESKPRMENYAQQLKRKERERQKRTTEARRKKRKLSTFSQAQSHSQSSRPGTGRTTKKQEALYKKAAKHSAPWKSNSSSKSNPIGRTASGQLLRSVKTSFCYPITFNWFVTETNQDEKCDWCESAFFGLCGYGETTVSLLDYFDTEKQIRTCKEIEGGHSDEGRLPSNMCVLCTMNRVRVISCQHEIRALPDINPRKFDEIALHDSACALAKGNMIEGKLAKETKYCSICPAVAFFSCCSPQSYTLTGEQTNESNKEYGCSLFLCETCADLTRKIQGHYKGLESIISRVVAAAKTSVLGEYDESGLRADAEFLCEGGELYQSITSLGLEGSSARNAIEIDDSEDDMSEIINLDEDDDDDPDSWEA